MAHEITYDQWIKLLRRPVDIHWCNSLSVEERAKVHSQLPRLVEFLEHEQKELIKMKKLSDQFEREVGAKDTELSKERLRMRLRLKLANKKEAKAREKAARKNHVCSREDCKRCERRRERKVMAAQKLLDEANSKDPYFAEEQQYREPEKDNDDGENAYLQFKEPEKDKDDEENAYLQYREPEKDNDDGENAYLQYREPEKDKDDEENAYLQYREPEKDNDDSENAYLQFREPVKDNDDDEKEKDGQNGEADKYKDEEDDGNELGAGAFALPQDGAFALPQDGAVALPQDGAFALPQDGAFALPQDGAFALPQDGAFALPQDGASALPQEGASALPQDGASFFFYQDHQERKKMQGEEYFGDEVLSESRLPCPHLRMTQQIYEEQETKEEIAVRALMQLLNMSEIPESFDTPDNFNKFLNYNYKF